MVRYILYTTLFVIDFDETLDNYIKYSKNTLFLASIQEQKIAFILR